MRLSRLLLLPAFLVGVSFAQSTNFLTGPQYLITTDSPQYLRPISTPSMSLSTPLPALSDIPQIGPPVANQVYSVNPALQGQANLFPIYYGYPRVVDVELSSEPVRELPASVNDTGYLNVPSAQSLRGSRLGLTTPAEAAAYSKAHKSPATRVYTNADLEKLRSQ